MPSLRDDSESALRPQIYGHGALAGAKLLAGWLLGSRALLVAGAHSLACALASAGSWLAQRVGRSQGTVEARANAEALSRALLGIVFLVSGVAVFWSLAAAPARDPSAGGGRHLIGLAVAALSALADLGLALAARRAGGRARNPGLLAVARDGVFDALVGLVVASGFLGARVEVPWAEGVAAFAAAGAIAVFGWRAFRGGMNVLMDRVSDPDLRARIEATATRIEGVKAVRQATLRPLGSHYRVELWIGVEGELTVAQGARLARRVEQAVEHDHGEVDGVAVHVEPWIPEGSAWAAAAGPAPAGEP